MISNNIIQSKNTDYYSIPETVEHYSSYELRSDERWIVEHRFRGRNVLVVGCGAGRTVLPLLEKGYFVTGIDISGPMIEKARNTVVNPRVIFMKCDATSMNFNQEFDTVFFPFHSIDYMERRKDALEQARKALKLGGVLIYNTHNRFFFKYFFRYIASRFKPYVKEIVPYGYVWSYYANPYKEVGERIWRNSIQSKLPSWKKTLSSLCLPLFNKSCYIIWMNREV